MKTKVMKWNGLTMREGDAYEVYQEMCDEVFGAGEIEIEALPGVNAVLLHLMFVYAYEKFYEDLKGLLERLKVKMWDGEEREDRAALKCVVKCGDVDGKYEDFMSDLY